MSRTHRIVPLIMLLVFVLSVVSGATAAAVYSEEDDHYSYKDYKYIEDDLMELHSNQNLDEVPRTLFQEDPETTTSWYTVKDVLSKILKSIEVEKNKTVEGCTFRCSMCPENWAKDDQNTRSDSENVFIESVEKETNTDHKHEENNYHEDETTLSATRVGKVKVKDTDQLNSLFEEDYGFETSIYQSKIRQLLNNFNVNANTSVDNKSIEREKRDPLNKKNEMDSDEPADALESMISSFKTPTVIIGRQGGVQNNTRHKLRTTTTRTRRQRTRTSTYSTRKTTTAPRLDVDKLLGLIANLTGDYVQNLTEILKEKFEEDGVPSCDDDVLSANMTANETTELVPRTEDSYEILTGTIMGKCFVCGLEERMIPHRATCADAFAGEVLPLMQVDARARGHLAEYRKYCRWMNVPRYIINSTDPRSMWGRWTGGCSVRWIDVSGIYTQRTCRNRHRAVTGNHWVSKRMAKLEMALQRVDNGCIVSPMSSLVPLSRGISLFARFHACVCTGSWCNRASPGPPCTAHTAVLLGFSVYSIVSLLSYNTIN